MSKALLIIPQYDSVEIVFFSQETLSGGKNRGLNAWFCCRSCGGKFELVSDLVFIKCDSCDCDVSKAEATTLLKAYRDELDKLTQLVLPSPTKRSFWQWIFRRT